MPQEIERKFLVRGDFKSICLPILSDCTGLFVLRTGKDGQDTGER